MTGISSRKDFTRCSGICEVHGARSSGPTSMEIVRFGKPEQHYEELYRHHDGEECKRGSPGTGRYQRERSGDRRIHQPMCEAAETLALGSHAVGEDFAEIDPNHGALRKGKRGDESHQ